MNYALDAGPMLAFLNGEPGAEFVEDILTEPGSVCYAHAYNLCEVYYVIYRRAGATLAETAVRDLIELGIFPRADLDTDFWMDAGALKAQHAIALPDAFCLALARRQNATLVTTDRGELEPLVPLGICSIVFIR